ncbi:MAG: lipocalin [Afipia sp. 62-7]|nr:YeeE/YedE family protein [Afipia sp.]OJU20618.1 MAG: lipocalin [Afipia sp. 62-7]
MQNMSAWIQAFAGFAIGIAAGFAVRRARLCTFGAIEDALMGGDGRRLRVFGLALGIAILGTQALVVGGFLDPELTTYVPPALPLVAILLGGVMFGIGMAFVGTCGFGSLVRLGAGDLRALVVVIVLGGAAYATLRGILAGFRVGFLESFSLAMPEDARADAVSLSTLFLGLDIRIAIAVVAGVTLCWLALGDKRLRRAPRLLTGGIVLGLMVIAGWIATIALTDDFAGPPRPQSLTFVSTVGKALYAGLLNITNFADFGVGSVFGVVAGSCLAAWRSDELRWEAFDDDHEMRRHLTGAVLMGVGGILAGGCTIGQGLTAGSMLALSAPLAIGAMMVGARIGIAILVDGSPRDIFLRRWGHLLGKGGPAE